MAKKKVVQKKKPALKAGLIKQAYLRHKKAATKVAPSTTPGIRMNPSDKATELLDGLQKPLELRLIVDSEWKELQAEVAALTQAMPAFSAARGVAIVELPARVEALEQLIADLGQTIATINSSLNALRIPADLVYKLTANIGTVAEKVSTHEKILERLTNQIAEIHGHLKGLDDRVEALQGEVIEQRQRGASQQLEMERHLESLQKIDVQIQSAINRHVESHHTSDEKV